MIEMRIYGIVPGEGPQVYNIATSLIAEILDGCIPQNSTEFRDVYADGWNGTLRELCRLRRGRRTAYRRSGLGGSNRMASCTSPEAPL